MKKLNADDYYNHYLKSSFIKQPNEDTKKEDDKSSAEKIQKVLKKSFNNSQNFYNLI